MTEEVEMKGEWWLPELPKEKIQGIVRYKPGDRIYLELDGFFGSPGRNDFRIFDILLGDCKGTRVTLVRCVEYSRNQTFHKENEEYIPGGESKFVIEMMLRDVHFSTREDITFSEITVRFDNLDEWVNIHGFKVDFDIAKGSYSVDYETPKSLEFSLDEGWRLLIEPVVIPPSSSMVPTSVAIEQQWFLRFVAPEEVPFENLWTKIYYAMNLLTLACHEPIYPTLVEGKTAKNMTVISEAFKHYPPVEISVPSPGFRPKTERVLPIFILFTAKDIIETPEFFRNWMAKAEILSPVYNLFFYHFYAPRIYLDTRFMNCVQALEAYHRLVNVIPMEKKVETENMISRICDEFPEYEQEVKEGLEHSFEPSLRERLKDLLKLCSFVVVGTSKSKDKFIHKVKTKRNYLTHYDERLREEADSIAGEDLLDVIKKLELLIIIILLLESGLDKDRIAELIRRNRNTRNHLKI